MASGIDTNKVNSLLASFPGPTVLRAVTWYYWLVFLLSLAVSALVLRHGEHWQSALPGAVGLWFFVCALPGANKLSLGPDAFTVQVAYLLHENHRWVDIDFFEVRAERGRVIRFGRHRNERRGFWGRLFSGGRCSGRLYDRYGIDPDDLAALLDLWRERALRS